MSTIKINISNRWSGEIKFAAAIEADEDAPVSIKLGLAVKLALKKGADLRSTDLYGANLYGANLCGADLRSANLYGANLRSANLNGANLRSADLRSADLNGADLRSADLNGANLRSADLNGANLNGANLRSANLYGAKWSEEIAINRCPLQIAGLYYSTVFILDEHMQIGCQTHSLAEWASFDDRRILEMDGREALEFWRAWKAPLLAMAAADGRGVKTPASAEAPAPASAEA